MAEKLKLEPAPGKVIVKTETPDDRIGSIYIPESARGRSTSGIIVAVYEPFIDPADGEETEAFYKVGDRVIFGKHSGAEIEIDRETFIVLRENEILTKYYFREE